MLIRCLRPGHLSTPMAQSIASRLPTFLLPHQYREVWRLLHEQEHGNHVFVRNEVNSRIARILRIAISEVPHYADLGLPFKAGDITPDNALDSLRCFPFLEKKTIMEGPQRFLRPKYKVDKQPFRTSGGSTGQGIKVYYSAGTRFAEFAFFHYRWNRACGFRRNWRQMRFTASGAKPENEDPFSRIGPVLTVSPYHLNSRWLPSIYERARDFRPLFLHGYPSCLQPLADFMRERGLGLESVRGIALVSEAVLPGQLQTVREAFPNVPVVFHYGLCEVTNLAWGRWDGDEIISYECENTYGVTESSPHEDGYEEIVGTSCWNDVMPLIRYKTQDMGRLEDSTINSLDGRSQEFLISRSGARIPGMSISIDRFVWDYVEVFQKIQNRVGEVEFHIVPRANYSDEIGDRIMACQQKKWGGFFDLRLFVESEIKRTEGAKRRSTINNVTRSPGQHCK